MKTPMLVLSAVFVALAATGVSAATRLLGTGCCPLCK